LKITDKGVRRLFEISVVSKRKTEFIDISKTAQEIVKKEGIDDGICVLFVPHTTAAITVNENADPDVIRDINYKLNKIVPFDDGYLHKEGNSDAHIKASLVGNSITLMIHDGKIILGTWQGIYFCEFDGPRERKVFIKVLHENQ
jgi:secondary thiamine-phosphate synthase enzyme